ncbi:hypothetical protein SAMN05660461_4020 [Chitinophaga ginsengisegetis]|uniref:Uncharacterized protein n=1 Tax=Chitinophaga ginsengisegetis TaxID=393003 RepID=A0A1T5P725_9BACT|nr:hypothetical protein [Chitinophaga ginsengisegetis]SKD08069.1 hypothetical protein SAMN05660461_4020 [Chitinophaga ginsengisegetis]
MSLLSFQKALTDLIASPQLCLQLRNNPAAVLSRYDLTSREQRRLQTVVYQQGMSVSCTLYRVNRITPIYTMLPYTCFLLGEQLMPVIEEFWAIDNRSDLQFKREINIFGEFLLQKLLSGEIVNPYLREIVVMELAMNELKFLPRELLMETGDDETSIHPLVRLVPFDHPPEPLLTALAGMKLPEREKDTGEYWLMLDHREEELSFRALPHKNGAAAVAGL